jgi:uncharacterized membrane protein
MEMFEVMVMIHALFGLLVLLAGIWAFVEALNVNQSNLARIRGASLVVAVAMWLTFIVAGYWYVVYYGADKALILKGPWPFAHSFFMETKEHVVLMLLLLATFLPIVAQNDLVGNRGARNLFLCVAGLIVLIGVATEGSGGIISMGAKLAAMPR